MADKITGNSIYDPEYQLGEHGEWDAFIEPFEGYDIPHAQVPYYVVISGGADTGATYTIKFANEDGTVLQISTLSAGTIPTYTGATPTKDATVGYTYTFAGWQPAIAKATKDVTYTAYYTAVAKKYPLTINGAVVEQVDYGTSVSISAVTNSINPEYLDNQKYSIEWKDESGNTISLNSSIVMDENGITLTYTTTRTPHTITLIASGETYMTVTSGYGETLGTVANPEKTGYDFTGWNPAMPSTMPASDMTIVAQYTAKKYTISFKDYDGTVISENQVAYDTLPTAPASPTREATIEYTYAFTGWDPEIVKVTGDATYTAQYSATARMYTINFVNYDDSALESYSLSAHTMPAYTGATPTKPEDAQYTYTFNTWDPAIAEVTENATYKASYTETVRSYDITFVLNNGEADVVKSVEYGQMPTCDEPSKASDVQYDYAFSAWNPTIVAVTGPKTYNATYKETLRQYNVIINGVTSAYTYGSVLALSDVVKNLYGEEALDTNKYIVTITDGTTSYTTGDSITVTGAITLTISKEATPHTITFYNDESSVLKTINSTYGAAIDSSEVPALPTKEGYDMAWDSEVPTTCPDHDVVIRAVATVKQYTITYYVDGVQDGEVEEYDYGTPIAIRADKTKEGYTFSGWDKVLPATMPAENIVINGTFSINSYNLTFNLDGAVYSSMTVEYNAAIEKPVVTPDSGYTVSEWVSTDGKTYTNMPAHDVTYSAETSKKYVTVEILTKTEQEDGSFITVTAKTDTAVTWGEVYTLTKPTYDENVYTFAWNVTEPWTPAWSESKITVIGTLSLIKEATTIYYGAASYSDITGATDDPTMLTSLTSAEDFPSDGKLNVVVAKDSNYETNYNLYYNDEEWDEAQWATYIQSISRNVVIIAPASIDINDYKPIKRGLETLDDNIIAGKSIKINGGDYKIWYENHVETIAGYNVNGYHPENEDIDISITLTIK